MTIIDSFETRMNLIKKYFEDYKEDKEKPEHSAVCELFHLYADAMSWFYAEERNDGLELEKWRDNLKLAGIKSHNIYTRLKEKGVSVVYAKPLLENRKKFCKVGPESLDFHLHYSAVENLLDFCIIGTSDIKKLHKMRIVFDTRRQYASPKRTRALSRLRKRSH